MCTNVSVLPMICTYIDEHTHIMYVLCVGR